MLAQAKRLVNAAKMQETPVVKCTKLHFSERGASANGVQQESGSFGVGKHFSEMKLYLQKQFIKLHKFGHFLVTKRRKCNKKIVAKRHLCCYNTTNIFPGRTTVRHGKYNPIIP